MKKSIKTALAAVTGMVAVAGAVSVPVLVSAWGDSDNGRPEYTQAQINAMMKDGSWAKNKIVFNSIKDGAIGHEFNYVGARECVLKDNGRCEGDSKTNVFEPDDITVEDGKTYIVRLYVHNNNPYDYQGVAENTKVSFNIPAYSASQIKINGFLTASNAKPYEYVDYVNLNSKDGTPFHVDVKYETALLENGGFAKGGVALNGQNLTNAAVNSDGSWKGGVLIGYDALDGRVPGCFKYDEVVTVQVKVTYDYDFTVEKKVRIVGDADKTWKDAVDAKIGDLVEFQIQYKNTSKNTQSNVAVRDLLPSNLRYIAGSTVLYNSNHPSGATASHDYLVEQSGTAIGAYGAGANAIIRLTAEVVDDNLACGKNTMVNWGQASVGQTVVQDFAKVNTVKTEGCDKPKDPDPTPDDPEPTPTPGKDDPTDLPHTGPEAVAGGVIAAGTTVTAAGYYIASRRALRK